MTSKRLTRLVPHGSDILLALVLAGLSVGYLYLFQDRRPFPDFGGANPNLGPFPMPRPAGFGAPGGPEALSYLLVCLCAAGMLFRRANSWLALAIVAIFAAAALVHREPTIAVQLTVLVGLYFAVSDSSLDRTLTIVLACAVTAGIGIALASGGVPRTEGMWAMDIAFALGAIFVGDSASSRRKYALELETSQEERAYRRISDERLEIARELHDLVGHSIALINIQAGAGKHVLYKDPEKAQETFATIMTAAQATLKELRALVSVLRKQEELAPLAPLAGLAGVDSLVNAVRDAGQPVKLEIEGARRQLPGIVDLSAYRILQEALTNTVNHAPGAPVRILIRYRDSDVSLEVTNDAGSERDGQMSGGGHGLVGMQERVIAIGGRFEAGHRQGGGFRVSAVLPMWA